MRSLVGTLTDIFGNEYSYQKDHNILVENAYGIIASLDSDNSFYARHLSDELKDLVLTDAEKLKTSQHRL